MKFLDWITLGFLGTGAIPRVPGTAASLAAAFIPFLLARIMVGATVQMLSIALVLAGAIWLVQRAPGVLPRLGPDPKIVTLDEACGMWLTLIGHTLSDYRIVLVGFVLFRFFDVVKPFPIRRVEKLPGGVGIVADDLAAGLASSLLLFIIFRGAK